MLIYFPEKKVKSGLEKAPPLTGEDKSSTAVVPGFARAVFYDQPSGMPRGEISLWRGR